MAVEYSQQKDMDLKHMSYYNHITDDLDAILAVLPEDIRAAVQQIGRRDELLEAILELMKRKEI